MIKEIGVLTYKSEVETGKSKNGNDWAKQTIVVSIEGRNAPYDKVALSVFGAKCNDITNVKVGDKVEVTYSVSAREYNGRWYNDVSLFQINVGASRFQSAPVAAAPAPANDDPANDLPWLA